jgi:hypothetical protein
MRDAAAITVLECLSDSCVKQIAACRLPRTSRSRTITDALVWTRNASGSSNRQFTMSRGASRDDNASAIGDLRMRVGGAGAWAVVGACNSAATTAGADRTTLSWIHRVMQGFASLAVFAVLSASAMEAPGPWGIDDPGIEAGVLRTEFDDPVAGTALRPLRVDCAASANPTACARIDTVFRVSNSYASESFGPMAAYWMLTVNNDKSFVERCEENGPPDQSITIRHPGNGLAGVSSSVGPTGRVIDLDVNQLDFQNPCGSDAAPFVGFGAHWGRGNSTPIGYLNAEGSVTVFTTRLNDFASGEGFIYARHWMYAIATWGGVRHFVAVHLFALDGDGDGSLAAPEDNGVTSDWKWPYLDSWYYPGAKVAVFPARAVGLSTLQKGADVGNAVDWQLLFKKAWPDMPNTPIPIEAVAFANEVAGAVHLHTAVSGVRQMSASPGTPTVSLRVNGGARVEVAPGAQLNYAWQADNALWVFSAWRTRDARCGFGTTFGVWEAGSPFGSSTALVQAAQSECTYNITITACSYTGCASDGITVVVHTPAADSRRP